jgi:hypothetical protein
MYSSVPRVSLNWSQHLLRDSAVCHVDHYSSYSWQRRVAAFRAYHGHSISTKKLPYSRWRMNLYHPPQRNRQGQDPGVRGRHLSLLGECLACFGLAVVNTPSQLQEKITQQPTRGKKRRRHPGILTYTPLNVEVSTRGKVKMQSSQYHQRRQSIIGVSKAAAIMAFQEALSSKADLILFF